MKLFFRVFGYARNLKLYVPQYIIFVTLSVIFGAFNFVLLIPLLEVLFGVEEAEVVENPGEYSVTTVDGRSHSATDIQSLEGADLALIYFDTDKNYTIVKRGNSDSLIDGQKI